MTCISRAAGRSAYSLLSPARMSQPSSPREFRAHGPGGRSPSFDDTTKNRLVVRLAPTASPGWRSFSRIVHVACPSSPAARGGRAAASSPKRSRFRSIPELVSPANTKSPRDLRPLPVAGNDYAMLRHVTADPQAYRTFGLRYAMNKNSEVQNETRAPRASHARYAATDSARTRLSQDLLAPRFVGLLTRCLTMVSSFATALFVTIRTALYLKRGLPPFIIYFAAPRKFRVPKRSPAPINNKIPPLIK